jgi:hypothetical protein
VKEVTTAQDQSREDSSVDFDSGSDSDSDERLYPVPVAGVTTSLDAFPARIRERPVVYKQQGPPKGSRTHILNDGEEIDKIGNFRIFKLVVANRRSNMFERNVNSIQSSLRRVGISLSYRLVKVLAVHPVSILARASRAPTGTRMVELLINNSTSSG